MKLLLPLVACGDGHRQKHGCEQARNRQDGRARAS
jgi:hypothetical protein